VSACADPDSSCLRRFLSIHVIVSGGYQEMHPRLIHSRISSSRQRTQRPSRIGFGARPSATNLHQLRRDTPTIAAAVRALTISTAHLHSTTGDPVASFAIDVNPFDIMNTSSVFPFLRRCRRPRAVVARLAFSGLQWCSWTPQGHLLQPTSDNVDDSGASEWCVCGVVCHKPFVR